MDEKDTKLKVTSCEILGELPDPFRKPDGSRIHDVSEWEQQRKELLKTAVELQYGTMPPAPEFLEIETLYKSAQTYGIMVHTGKRSAPVSFKLRVRLPKDGEGPFPVIVIGDACWSYFENADYMNAALDENVGFVFFDRTELAHDVRHEGRAQGALYRTYPEYTFGAIGAWAWGFSRAVDAIEKTDLPIDHGWIAFAGHSRGAKAAALAGALDLRARIVNPNSTCAGGCGCYRIHMKGLYGDEPEKPSETLENLLDRFAFWMGPELGKYRTSEETLPFDTHYLKALVAPRTLYVSEALGDLWANPVGSYVTTIAAKEVFRFLGAEDRLYWSFRPGFHQHLPVDIANLVAVLKHERCGASLGEQFFGAPAESITLPFDWRRPE